MPWLGIAPPGVLREDRWCCRHLAADRVVYGSTRVNFIKVSVAYATAEKPRVNCLENGVQALVHETPP